MSVDAFHASEHRALNIRLQFHESTRKSYRQVSCRILSQHISMAHDVVDANSFYDAFRVTDQPLRRPTTDGASFSSRQRDRVLSIPSRATSTDI